MLTFPFLLLKFTQFLKDFSHFARSEEGLLCARSLGNVPSAAQWYSKGFPLAVAAAGLRRQHPS